MLKRKDSSLTKDQIKGPYLEMRENDLMGRCTLNTHKEQCRWKMDKCFKSTCAAPQQGIEIRLQVNKIQSRFALTNDVGGLRLDFCPVLPPPPHTPRSFRCSSQRLSNNIKGTSKHCSLLLIICSKRLKICFSASCKRGNVVVAALPCWMFKGFLGKMAL